jgi:hypothetical protein
MRHHKLSKLARLRRMELDRARSEMIAAESAANEARRAAADAQAAIEHEMKKACSILADDAAAETFAAWLPLGRAKQTRAQDQCERTEQNLFRARTMFNLARAAAEAVQILIETRQTADAKAALRKEQHVLDETSRRRAP